MTSHPPRHGRFPSLIRWCSWLCGSRCSVISECGLIRLRKLLCVSLFLGLFACLYLASRVVLLEGESDNLHFFCTFVMGVEEMGEVVLGCGFFCIRRTTAVSSIVDRGIRPRCLHGEDVVVMNGLSRGSP